MKNRIELLSRLMKISWDIQRMRKQTRAKALQAAWAIISNEDITVLYLVRKLNRNKPISNGALNQFSLFN